MTARHELKALLLGIVAVPAVLAAVFVAVYRGQAGEVLGRILLRMPLLLTGSADLSSLDGGFCANVLISFIAMLMALAAGVALGACLISPVGLVRVPAVLVMNLLRSSPWLVLLYAILYLLPFEFEVFGMNFSVSPSAKATVGLALPVAAYVAEVVRGGVQAVPSAQWDSARALGYRRTQILRHVVVPQALPMMIPSLMNTYASLFIGTSLVVVTGTVDVLSMAKTVIGSDGDRFATGIYLLVLLLFFLFAFPIAIGSRVLERRMGARA